MPRKPREFSSSDIYHIMVRGVNKQPMFHKTSDYDYFLRVLADNKEEMPYALYAFCLMPNHVHLLMKIDFDKLSHVMKAVGSKYASWFNVKYDRVGHLFQDRFKSEPVENDRYFLTVLRYIHRNPVKAMMVQEPDGYPYSSYPGYFTKQSLIDTKLVRAYMNEQQFVAFHTMDTDDKCMDIDNCTDRLTDEQALRKMYEITKTRSSAEFLLLPLDVRSAHIKTLYDQGLSKSQIQRCTGSSYKKVTRALSE